MKIAATKVFADYINKTAQKTGKKFQAEFVELPEYAYSFYVGDDIFTATEFGDLTSKGYKAIVIRYPFEFYAGGKYLSTYQLTKEFRRRGVKTEKDLQDMIIDLLEV